MGEDAVDEFAGAVGGGCDDVVAGVQAAGVCEVSGVEGEV